ncbi:hypothetical protein LTR85_004454 [Meristemomyces frigidus]|nr:hypothetical protein LTR85_004454 [Meristemomyces frigidus]
MPAASTVLILAMPFVLGIMIALTCGELFNRRTTYRRQDALLARPPRFAREARDRARKRAWPFNAPRAHPTTDEEAGSSHGYGTFDGFDGAQPAAYNDIETDTDFNRRSPPSVHGSSLTPSQDEQLTNNNRIPPPRHLPDHELVRHFAESGEGQAKLVKLRETGELLVVKTIASEATDGQVSLPNEVKALSMLTTHHPNILAWRGYNTEQPSSGEVCNIMLEYCAGGDLYEYCNRLIDNQRLAAPVFVLHFIASMVDALAYLHLGYWPSGLGKPASLRGEHQPIIHSDVKAENIFLRWPGSGKHEMPDIVLGDFGFTVLESESRGLYGTNGYYPPEAIRVQNLYETDRKAYRSIRNTQILTRASDIYTFGASLYCLAMARTFDNSKNVGFNGHEPPGLANMFAETDLDQFPFVLDIMKRCLADDPADRIKTGELYAMAVNIKDLVADMYESGARMTDTSVSRWEAQSQLSSPASSVYSESARPSVDMSQISGFSDEFCWCPNHGSLSSRRPGPNCVHADPEASSPSVPLTTEIDTSMTARLVVGATATLRDLTGAPARARSYQAVLQSRFSDSSDDGA